MDGVLVIQETVPESYISDGEVWSGGYGGFLAEGADGFLVVVSQFHCGNYHRDINHADIPLESLTIPETNKPFK